MDGFPLVSGWFLFPRGTRPFPQPARAIAGRSPEVMSSFKAQELANVIWAIAKLSESPGLLFSHEMVGFLSVFVGSLSLFLLT